MTGLPAASELLGPVPPRPARPVSLATKRFFERQLPAGAGVLVAVSGGADSLALAVAALDQAARQGRTLGTVTVDHGLRPESAAEAVAVAQQLAALGVHEPVVARVSADASASGFNAGQLKAGPEGNARDLRLAAVAEAAHQFAEAHSLQQVVVLLGHTADDQAETVLLRLGRGSGTRSLAGMRELARWEAPGRQSPSWLADARQRSQEPPAGGIPGEGAELWRGRPLLHLRRRDTEAFCRALDLPYVQDPTNRANGPWRTAAGEPLRRAAVRESALPALSAALGQDAVPALTRTAEMLQEDGDALDELAERLYESALREPVVGSPFGHIGSDVGAVYSGGGALPASEQITSELIAAELDCAVLAAAPPALAKRALRRFALAAGADPAQLSHAQIGALWALVGRWHGQGPVQLAGGVQIARGKHGRLSAGPTTH